MVRTTGDSEGVILTKAHTGDVLYLRTLGQHTIVLNGPAAISEFLEKRAANTSDRLVTPVIRLWVSRYLCLGGSEYPNGYV